MKIITTTVTRVELDDGDDTYGLYSLLGDYDSGLKVTGVIEIHEVDDE